MALLQLLKNVEVIQENKNASRFKGMVVNY